MKISDIESKVVVVIKGNPEKMKGNERLADEFYNNIKTYITNHGYFVEFDNGEDYTCPRSDAVFWVAHSRGVSREICIDEKNQWRFLKFGILDGIIHPVDKEWQESLVSYHDNDMPPKEHFIFTQEQKDAIDDVIKELENGNLK